MRKYFTLLFSVLILILASCKKEHTTPKPPISDMEFTLYDVRATGDSTIFEVNHPSTFILKGDYTWTIDLGGSKSSGSYTWTPTTNQQANVKFTISQWTDFSANQILSDKLKSALLAVKNCGYSLQRPSFANFLDLTTQEMYFPSIRTNKK